ncbi:ABC transporter permease [Chelatococcus sp. GCM10030263]|uniref:ABC transporter permease n=1 Tax=Chelatococcus sp. GCM10030263 TaxID=3273387 RepID=UPI00360E64E4
MSHAVPAAELPQRRQMAAGMRLSARQFLRNPAAVAGLVVLVLICLAAMFAPWIAPRDPVRISLATKLRPPGPEFWLGTDFFGRDVLSRLIHGARVSLSVGILVISFSTIVGVPLGLFAGMVGGRLDNILMRLMDALLTFPPLLLGVAIVGLLGPDLRNVTLGLGIVQVPVLVRLVRASALAAREDTYVMAARALGASNLRIAMRHVLRNIMSPIVVQLTIGFSAAIIAEASLSFLGLGTQPPQPSWGRDLAEARRYMADAPWLFLAPTGAIMLSVLAVNFVGDGLRDALDPRSWRSRRKEKA